ncbi:hypothetical protein SteCoe_12260 [Stentor coeruleus]|uniref:EF-hand domain-containing protein n=1 Tax=Stentor coeruleus TaxID=5963 RepID=A0A1R2CB82_9CILI|nr:hypothetical protein SteCoe_12260 [Stentor coeruleus]
MVRLLKKAKGKNPIETQPSANIVEKYEGYLRNHKIHELFNKLLTQILHDRPVNVRHHILEQLSNIKNQIKNPSAHVPAYLTSGDFETMFDAYDIAGEGSLDYYTLLQAMMVAGVKNPEIYLKQDFPQITEKSMIGKPQFTQIMNAEFTKYGFS